MSEAQAPSSHDELTVLPKMESLQANVGVRLVVSQCLRTLSSSAEESEILSSLQTLRSLLDEGPASSSTSHQQADFRRAHYTRTLQFFVSNMQADWFHRLPAAQRTHLWDGLFLTGPPEQALLVLMEGIGQLRPSAGRTHLLSLTERFLQSGRLADLLWSYCLETGPPDSPQLREALVGRVVALPDVAANSLQHDNKLVFLPRQYYPLLAAEMLAALERTCQALKDGTDCSLSLMAQLLGKLCVQGHSGSVLTVLAPRLSVCTRSDMVWQRVCWKLLENVPERWMESVLTGLLPTVSGSDALGRILGDLVLTNRKARFVITHKMLLLQYKYETRVLQMITGYLAADRGRRPLLIEVLRSVSQAWANPSAVKHTPVEQQLYVSKALLLCVSQLSDSELQELRSELLQCMLGGMQSHLDSSVVRIRHMGMVVGETLSSRMNVNGTRLRFEYEPDEETRELRSLLTPAAAAEEPGPLEAGDSSSSQETEVIPSTEDEPPQNQPAPSRESDLDSDDELTPYDMSGDQEVRKAAPPRYLRDCLDALLSSEDPERVELSLTACEGLVRRNVFAAAEVGVQLSRVLLHLEDRYNLKGFLALRQAAMVALAVTVCVPVTQYLTTEFYAVNYSLRQRLDILEVLAQAAQELSRPIPDDTAPPVAPAASGWTPSDSAISWQHVVERRIQSKTRRLRKGATQQPPQATPNRYAPVAGHFFFPLLRNYDKPQVTFDLLGSDQLVLGRLIHTLGLLMHLAANAPVAAQMGRALMDFVWAVRYHADQMVRRGVLFTVCAVFLTTPTPHLLMDLSDQLLETRSWLADVAEGDLDEDCRSLAVQSLVLLDQNLKKHLQDPQPLSLES